MTLMTRIVGIGLVFVTLLVPAMVIAEPNTGGGPSTHDCAGVDRTCGSWGVSGANTCRTCQQAQCKTENGKDVLAGNKTQTECYEGHGSPPARGTHKPKVPLSKAPATGGVKH
jgi:hypothetical protein